MTDTKKSATLNLNGESYELPIFSPTAGPDVLDIRKLYGQAGVFTYDPGFTSTASCDSTITFIDGGKGELLHRGYPIDQLASKSHYLEVCYLLLYGELPSARQLEDFETRVTHHTMVHEQMINFFRGFRRDAHPMAIIVGVVGAMSAFYHDSTDITDEWQREVASIRLIAKMPTIAAMAFKYSIGQPFIYPRNDLDYASNFLRMCFAVPVRRLRGRTRSSAGPWTGFSHCTPITSRTRRRRRFGLRRRRVPTRSPASRPASPAFGGRPMAAPTRPASRCCEEIGSVDRIPEFVARAKDKDDPFRLMGFGHRVYKNFDPRAKVMKQSADEVLDLLGIEDNPKLQVAKELEKQALEDPYFAEKKLFPNVDFYSGIILEAMGFPTSMFTPIFALSRTVGWISQWKEMIADPQNKIGRPRQLYLGETMRDYVDIENR